MREQAPSYGNEAKPERSGSSGPPKWWGRAMPSDKGERSGSRTDCQRLGNPGRWNHKSDLEQALEAVFIVRPAQRTVQVA